MTQPSVVTGATKMKRIGIAAAVFTFVTVSLANAADIVTTPDGNTKVTMLKAGDMMIQATSQPAAIELHFANAERVDFGLGGELDIIKTNGSLVRYKPDVYQMVNGKLKPVGVSYKMNGNDRVTMKFSKFNKDAPLIVHHASATI
jgi:hypothetical protein